ncbi:efflux RND transporter periplasmic adaptor subunit [Aneurinibacillus aneurinilyticus]|uniref:Efflux transporter, RND family, MFP subunit n=1 Tax=Aneurinibacillus aneurinilyticus ATCC 12856 TaxID=649747 RepID=U1X3G2_ANEAE|nr:efflux RND transporter periplasmic adaptor subunit [Aneurinibacillus aneurinilyticus]ERI09088.1 efflux transporter, RND family, MFP subunit [Aneurinibacillus aneurinilyticus ATCC 12856]MED0707509.1 efflux RND transporter periplasmic adaptor subunit [Aneurinibacillus aneurinilyticus]MED0723877.1 efflux RND transporter periplasmic adaptor subunit [Aneurinibacillus aneurinilyticus]MED0731789.1 efflux RND transporter periplasmic adaptor subunit [Aneurinibacillus aneurinilyticus]MED0739451.1 eff
MGRRAKRTKAITYLLLGAVALAGCTTSAKEAASDAPISVKVAQAQEGALGGKVYTGTVMPDQKVNIMPKMAGKIIDIPVDVGMRVKKGQVLFRLEDKDLKNAVTKADAAVSAAQASIQTAQAARESGIVQATGGAVQSKNGVLQAKNAMIQAQGAITQANSALEQATHVVEDAITSFDKAKQALNDATTNHDRMKQLFAQGAVSQVQLDQAETALVNAQAGYRSAEIARTNAQEKVAAAKKSLATAQKAYDNASASYQNANGGYENAQKQVGVAQNTAGIEASQQALKQAQVGANIARDMLADATVVSPINGIIGAKNAEIGEMVSMQSPVLVVANLDTVNMLVYLPADQVNNVQPGSQVQVKASAFDYVTTGTVKNISPLDEKGKGYPVQITVANPDLKLKSGMLAEVRILAPDTQHGIVIPSSALVKEKDKTYVYVLEGDKAKRVEVKTSGERGAEALVTDGLKKGTRVITTNVALLSDGAKIELNQ